MPTWQQLQYAIAVDEHRHFGKASAACRVTQPTLSQQLQKLEDEVGVILFDRAKKPILPTPEGERFLAQAKVVLREQEKLLHLAKQREGEGASGEFKLGVIPTVASDLLPRILEPFARMQPRVRLTIEELKTETILSELANDRLDGAILATPITGADLKVHPLYYEPFFVYFSAGHALLKHASIARVELNSGEMWLLQDGHCFKDQVLSFCALPTAPLTDGAPGGGIQFRSGSLDTLRRLVQNGRGYTLIPAMMALALRKPEREAHVRPLKSPVPTREISLVYRRDHWKLAVLRAIEDTVASHLPDSIPARPEKAMKVLEVS